MRVLSLFLLLSVASFSVFSISYAKPTNRIESVYHKYSPNQNGPAVLLPVFVRLQALQETDLTLWESLPRVFIDHVGTIDTKVLAMFISSNTLSFDLSGDNVGNLWMALNYSFNAGDYMSTLMWVSSVTTREDLSSLGFVPFPENYPEDVKVFLKPGDKMPVTDSIRTLAAIFNQTQSPPNMTRTVENVLEFVSHEEYDAEKTRLLLSGELTTTDILDAFKDALQVQETNSSICIERAWYAAAILRAAGVPTRTVTDVRLKTWIQVWLNEYGWIDAEALCVQPPPRFPRPLSASTPWMIENSSDAAFPFMWLPKASIRVANLTFSDARLFNVNEYSTLLSEPIDKDAFAAEPSRFMFPIVLEPEIIYAAITREGSDLTFSLVGGRENASRALVLGDSNSVSLGDVMVSFKPVWKERFVMLRDFSVRGILRFDFRLLVPVVGVPLVVAIAWLYWRKRVQKHSAR